MTARKLQLHKEVTSTEDLKSFSLFDDLKNEPKALELLKPLITSQVFKAGDTIIKEREQGTAMYFLTRGKAAIFKSTLAGEEYKVFVLEAEKKPFFGEGALVDSESRSATIRAETECECLVFDQKGFAQFCQEHPQWALPIFKRIAKAVMARLRKTNDDMLLLYNALVSEIRGS